jgi:spore germination protein GerM
MTRRAILGGVIAALMAAFAWLLFVELPRRYGGSTTNAVAASPPVAPAAPGRKIKAHLFYVSDDGTRLTSVERDVAFGEGTVEQARQIIEAQIAPASEPLVSAVPPGTMLRAIFISERGEAFVDLSHELVDAQSGGTMSETLTVYTFVNALTDNLPAVTSVQVLVEGKQVDTLAGHIDLRRPLEKNLTWVQ